MCRDWGVILRKAYEEPIHPGSSVPTLTHMKPEQQPPTLLPPPDLLFTANIEQASLFAVCFLVLSAVPNL